MFLLLIKYLVYSALKGVSDMKKFFSSILCAALIMSALPMASVCANAQELGSPEESGTAVTANPVTSHKNDKLQWSDPNINGEIAIIGVTDKTNSEIIIPDTIDGFKVTKIADNAFINNQTITKVTLPDTVTSIGMGAFMNCKNLKSVNIPKNVKSIGIDAFRATDIRKIFLPKGLENLGSGAFQNCKSLTAAALPSTLERLENETFKGCSSLRSIKIPEGVKALVGQPLASTTLLSYGVFEDCTSLETVTLPSSLEKIGEAAFRNCSSLTDISVPSSVKKIGSYAFSGCSSLKNINIPEKITVINDSVFRGSGLKSIDIPEGVDTIGTLAFADCEDLTEVRLPRSVTNIAQSDVFPDLNNSFANSQNVTFTVYSDSYAKAYAKNHGIPFTEIGNYISPQSVSEFVGDVDADGSVTSADSLAVLRYSVGIIDLGDSQKAAADTNGDGMIDSLDSLEILRYTVGYSSEKIGTENKNY